MGSPPILTFMSINYQLEDLTPIDSASTITFLVSLINNYIYLRIYDMTPYILLSEFFDEMMKGDQLPPRNNNNKL